MKKYVQNYHCGVCDNGVVTSTLTVTKSGVRTLKFQNCNVCGEFYGLKKISELKEINTKIHKEVPNG